MADTAVGLREAGRRIGLSYRTSQRLIARGQFPIPELPRLPGRSAHRFSTRLIDEYLADAAVRPVQRGRHAA